MDSTAPIAVAGLGTMGAGIAQLAASAGHPVLLYDGAPDAADRAVERIGASLQRQIDRRRINGADRDAILGRLSPQRDLDELAPASVVIEAIAEDLDAKQGLLARLEAFVDTKAILASNTSSLSITALAASLAHPGRCVGMHFFNPAPAMPLVEVVSGLATTPQTAKAISDLAMSWGKTPVQVRSTPGFIVNRIARPFYGEPLRIL